MTSRGLSYVKEYLTAISINLSAVLAGALSVASIYMITSFESSEDISYLKKVTALIAPIESLGMAIGSIIAFVMLKMIGRKKSLMVVIIPSLISWILILVPKSYIHSIFIYFMGGVTTGIIYTTIPIYIAEIASDKIRGSLGSLQMLHYWIGYTIARVFREFVSYQNLSYISLILPILMGLTYLWIPETPTYYLMQHRDEEAKTSLNFLRNNRTGTEFDLELESLRTSVTEDEKKSKMFTELVRTAGNRKAMLVMAACAVGAVCSGMEIYFIYNINLFDFETMIDIQNCDIIALTLSLVVATLPLFTVDWIGRRKLLLISAVGLVLSNLVSAGLIFMKYYEIDMTYFYWIPTLAMIVIILSYGIGFSTISFVLLGELFPNNIKEVAALFYVLLFATLHALYYHFLLFTLDLMYIFILNSIMMSIIFVVIFFFLPETKGKSLREIQFILNNRSQRNVAV